MPSVADHSWLYLRVRRRGIASWVAGAVFFVQTLRDSPATAASMWLAIVAWPFATSQIARRQGAAYAQNVNKALVAFMACILIGMAAFAASANLHRFAKQETRHAGTKY